MKKAIWMAVCFVMAFSLIFASCGGDEDSEDEGGKETESQYRDPEEPKYGGTYIDLTMGDPSGFDPRVIMNLMCPTIWITHDELLTGDWTKGPAGTEETDWSLGFLGQISLLTGKLVDSWELPDDETIIYHLMQGVHFSYDPENNNEASRLVNGREMTADDVAWSAKTEWEAPGSNFQVFFKPEQWLTEFNVIDKYTVEFKTPPTAQGTNLLESGERLSIFAPEVTAKWGDQNDLERSVGIAAFILQDYVAGSSITYKRNPNYHAHDPFHPENQLPYVDYYKQLIIPDSSTQLASFRTGKIDMRSGITWEDFEILTEQITDFMYTESYGWTWIPCGRMDKDLPFNDLKVRQALNMAVNQQELVDDYYQGNAQLMGWPFYDIPAHQPFYTPLEEMPQICQDIYGYDPERAKQLLADAGYPDGFKTKIACTATHESMLSIVKNYLIDVGVDMELQVFEGSIFNGVNRGRTHDEMIYKETKMYSMPWHMFEVRDDNADGVAFFEHPRTREVYNTIGVNLGKNDAVWINALKDVVPFMIEQAWGIYMPVPKQYTMWWPWIQNFRGEVSIGNFTPATHVRYIWIDEEMKTAMGY